MEEWLLATRMQPELASSGPVDSFRPTITWNLQKWNNSWKKCITDIVFDAVNYFALSFIEVQRQDWEPLCQNTTTVF